MKFAKLVNGYKSPVGKYLKDPQALLLPGW